jgi:hypothetical protein
LLQTASSDNRPSFIEILPVGQGYIGGDTFFSSPEPEHNPSRLISIIPNEDKTNLLNDRAAFPEGLRDAILFFLLGGAAAKVNLGLPQNGKGYQFLCHPSLKNSEQAQARKRISKFLTEVRKILGGNSDTLGIIPALNEQYRKLKLQLTSTNTPAIGVLKSVIDSELKREKILVINASNNKRRGIEYGPGFNFLIGGNTLGRGIAIPNLLVTYYVRQAVTSQMDTMHQHARMFGYRQKTLPYTQLFLTLRLYYRFSDIYTSDQSLRAFIESHISTSPSTFPIDTSLGLVPTRRNVLDAEAVETVVAGMQLFPNRMKKQTAKSIKEIWSLLFRHFGVRDKIGLNNKARTGSVTISIDDALDIVKLIKTRSESSWHDKSIADVLRKVSERLGKRVLLKYRPASRNVVDDGDAGLISSGTLSGAEQNQGRAQANPTLWIMDVTPNTQQSLDKFGILMFPTVIVPNILPKVFLFSKK